jgi:hypothetical protein
MKMSKYFKISTLLVLVGVTGCSKLNESYTSTLPYDQVVAALGAKAPALLLSAAYNDIPPQFVGQDQVFSLQENTTDESLVPTRGGDWDDNGVWRVVHNHSWNADHGQVTSVFNGLNVLQFDATNVLAFKPSAEQAAEARFLRALSLYFLLDLYNQYPFRPPNDTLINPSKVFRGAEAMDFIISELNAVLPDLDPTNPNSKANQDAVKVLLMRCYLNRGAFLNRANPTFADADMQQVITLGNQIISSAKYSYMANYFGNFNRTNGNSTELIFGYPSPGSGGTTNNPGMQARWMMTFHYNEYTGQAPNAGWNGFTTTSDFYNSFGTTGNPTTYGLGDTLLDTRLGRRRLSDSITTALSGIRPGFLVGQQFAADGTALKDRKGAPLSFTPVIADNMIEQGTNLEVTGIRVAKYVPDFSSANAGSYYSSNAGNWLTIFRYPDVVLMVAEALKRQATPNDAAALVLVNGLRTARGAAPLATLPLVGASVDDGNSLLAERGRELYWESVRRTDLIRFKAYQMPWQYKPASGDADTYLVFPVPNQALAVNPNLTQNPGY